MGLPYKIFTTKLYNAYAVDVFILISGFSIAAMLAKKSEPYLMYITRRFFRIFPAYLFFLVLSIILAPAAAVIWEHAPNGFMKASRMVIANDTLAHWTPHVLAHLAALQGLVPMKLLPSTDYAFLGQAWSISLEWQFYLIAPFLIAAVRNRKNGLGTMFTLGACMVVIAASTMMPYGFIGRSFHKFILGILSYYLLADIEEGKISRQTVAQGALLSTVCLLFLKTPAIIPYLIWIGTLAIIALKPSNMGAAVASRFLTSAPIQRLGQLSYSVYLSHMFVILALLATFESFGITNLYTHAALLLALVVPCTLLVSVTSYELVERPLHTFGKNLGRKAPAQSS